MTWDILSRVKEQQRIEPGSAVCTQGEHGTDMFFVKDGELDVEVEGAGKVHVLGEGDFFGEKALLAADDVRTATVRATTPCLLLSLSKVRALPAELHSLPVRLPLPTTQHLCTGV